MIKVRTKDRTFESVSHLINYHRNNILPIISAESVLLLKRPVPRTNHLWIDSSVNQGLSGTCSSQEQIWKTPFLAHYFLLMFSWKNWLFWACNRNLLPSKAVESGPQRIIQTLKVNIWLHCDSFNSYLLSLSLSRYYIAIFTFYIWGGNEYEAFYYI